MAIPYRDARAANSDSVLDSGGFDTPIPPGSRVAASRPRAAGLLHWTATFGMPLAGVYLLLWLVPAISLSMSVLAAAVTMGAWIVLAVRRFTQNRCSS